MAEMRPGRNGGKLKSGGVHKNSGRPKLPDLKGAMAELLDIAARLIEYMEQNKEI